MFSPNQLTIFILLLAGLLCRSVYADQCPSPEIIKDRKITRQYEWYIDERRTLEDVLSVERLYSVRIRKQGELVTCYYSTKERLLEMDAKPIREGCEVIERSGGWQVINEQEKVCMEQNPYNCHYAIYCDERSNKADSNQNESVEEE